MYTKRHQNTENGRSDPMTSINEEYITSYIRELTPKRSELLSSMEEYAKKENIPIIEPEVAQLIKTLVTMNKPKNVLEVGTAIGYSAILIGESLKGDWHITTLERSPKMIEKAYENIEKAGFKDKIKVIEGDALITFPHLSAKYDFIFIDAAKGHYLEFFSYAVKLLVPGGIILSDNVLYKGMVATDKLVVRRKRTIVNRLREYLSHINSIDGFISSVIPLGDGVAITYKE